MATLLAAMILAGMAVGGPASASRTVHPGPYSSRGDCEAHSAALGNDDRESLLDRFPQFFSTTSEVSAFLTRAFRCERAAADRQWYIRDHRLDVINSEWFQRRAP